MQPDRKNLIDTRGRQSLMSTLNRRRDSVQTAHREHVQSPTPEPPAKMRRPDVDLGAMLRPEHLPSDKYYAIQKVLFEQDKLITDRGNEIKDRCTQISTLHKDLKDANARIDRDQDRLAKKTSDIAALEKQLFQVKKEKEAAIRESRNRKRQFDEMNDDLFEEDLIKVGRKILAEKNQEVERLVGENTQLRATVGERDATISSLNDQILRVCTNSGDERVAIALEAQAQRTLSMVKGLQKDVAKGGTVINEYKAKHEALIAANESFKTENADLRAKVVESERGLKAVQKRATEQSQILEDQDKFIEKLMKDNAQIVEASQKMK